MKYLKYAVLILIVFIPSSVQLTAGEAIVVDKTLTFKKIASFVDYFEDPSGSLKVEQIDSLEYRDKFAPLGKRHINFGLTQSAIWLRIVVDNTTNRRLEWYLNFFGDTDVIDFYFPRSQGFGNLKSGCDVPYEHRSTESVGHAFPVVQSPGKFTYYVRLKSERSINLFASLVSPKTFNKMDEIAFAMIWIFFGIILTLSIYNIFIYFSVRDKSYLYLVYSIISYSMMIFFEMGMMNRYLGITSHEAPLIFICIALISLLQFTRSFLNTNLYLPAVDKVMRVAVISLVPVFIIILFVFQHSVYLSGQMEVIASILVVGLTLWCGTLAVLKKVREARYYMLSASLFLVGLLFSLLNYLSIISLRLPFVFDLVVGFLVLVFLFSLGVTRKITRMRSERLKALEKAQATESRLRSFYKNATEGIYQMTPQMEIITLNPAMAEIFGFQSVENVMAGTCFKSFFDDDSQQKIYDEMNRKGMVKNCECRARRKDGRRIFLSVSAYPVLDDNGDVLYYEGFMLDITERKNADLLMQRAHEELEKRVEKRTKELKESEERYRQLIETMNEGFAIIDQDVVITYVNPKLCHMCGYEKDDLVGKRVSDFLDKKNQKILGEKLASRLNKKELIAPYELEWIRKDGSALNTIVSPRRIYDEDDNFMGSASVITDITSIKEVEVQLKHAKEAAEHANRAKSEFLANMSHEIRTPLNSVLGFTDLLNGLISDKKQRSYLSSIKSSGKNLLMLINDILDLSKIEAGRLDISYEAVNLFSIFNEIRQIFSIKIEEKGLAFITEVAPAIPESLLLDEVRLRQILFNLIGNAVKFTETGHIKVSVREHFTREDRSSLDVIIAIEDTGIGIPPESQQKIFDAFRQQDGQTTKKYGGTGLGLAITKRLVEMMGGEISVTSEVGKGSTFEIVLHDINVATTAALSQGEEFETDHLDVIFERATILVVDDIAPNRELVKEFLLRKNFCVLEAENGLQAVEMTRKYKPDALLMDIKMPVMNGYQAAHHIKADKELADIPLIALTASAMKGDREKVLSEGFDGFLHKPVQLKRLYCQLARFLKHTHPKENIGAPGDTAFFSVPKELQRQESGSSDDTVPEQLLQLVDQLETNYLETWETVRKNGIFNDIIEFARSIQALGDEYGVSLLIQYGEELSSHADNFDIENMNVVLQDYPGLIKKIKALDQ